jgi:hypothetical protein
MIVVSSCAKELNDKLFSAIVSPVRADAWGVLVIVTGTFQKDFINTTMICIIEIGKITASAIKPPDIRFFTVPDFEAQLSGLEKLAEKLEPQGTISEL